MWLTTICPETHEILNCVKLFDGIIIHPIFHIKIVIPTNMFLWTDDKTIATHITFLLISKYLSIQEMAIFSFKIVLLYLFFLSFFILVFFLKPFFNPKNVKTHTSTYLRPLVPLFGSCFKDVCCVSCSCSVLCVCSTAVFTSQWSEDCQLFHSRRCYLPWWWLVLRLDKCHQLMGGFSSIKLNGSIYPVTIFIISRVIILTIWSSLQCVLTGLANVMIRLPVVFYFYAKFNANIYFPCSWLPWCLHCHWLELL